MYFGNYRVRNTFLDKCLKSPNFDDASTSNMVNGPKNCFTFNASIVPIFIDHFENN